MNGNYILSDYIDFAMSIAEYEKLDDGKYFGRVPGCSGAISVADSLEACKEEMRSVFEDWVLVGLRFKDELPILNGMNLNLNKEPVLEPMESL